MTVLEQFNPQSVFYFFEKICQIPHGTENTKKLSDYCAQFAKDRGLDVTQDSVGNIIIRKPGTKGYESSEPLILQGHLDMVCEKTPQSHHDFSSDPIELYVEDGYIKAKDTSLGADDGIAVAYMLALLDSNCIPHPPIEAVFTVDEETTMLGAETLDVYSLKGKKMINLDSEAEGILTVGCAGGLSSQASIPFTTTAVTKEILTVQIDGLLGGHSGVEIHRQRGNANKLMGKLLQHLLCQNHSFDLVSIQGGEKENVISSRCSSELAVESENINAIVKDIHQVENSWKKTFGQDEPTLRITTTLSSPRLVNALISEDTKRIIQFLAAAPQGVQFLDRNLKDQVETSLNLGIVKTEHSSLHLNYLIRSSIDAKRDETFEELAAFVSLAGGTINVSNTFPAWSYNPDSQLRPLMAEVYEDLFGTNPIVETIHGGLECGVFFGKRPDMDCVSIGPNLFDVHSVNEALDIASCERIWEYLKAILKKCK